MFKNVSYKKIEWLKNLTKGGAQDEVIKNMKPDEICVHITSKKHGRMWGSTTENHLLSIMNKNIGLYEVLHFNNKMKVYFDIDCKENLEVNKLEVFKNIILKYIPDCDFGISGSETDEENSYHITINNYIFNSESDRENFKLFVKNILYPENNGFDANVYTSNRNMKTINQSKVGDPRIQEIIENPDYRKHLINSFIEPDAKNIMDVISKYECVKNATKNKNGKLNILALPEVEIIEAKDINVDDLKSPLKILKLLPISPEFDHQYTFMVARFCYYHDLKI